MSKHIPDTAAANATLETRREASRRDHLPTRCAISTRSSGRTIRWPGETGKMLFHPTPEQPTAPNAGILRLDPGAHHPEHYHGFAQVWLILKGEFTIDGRSARRARCSTTPIRISKATSIPRPVARS